MREWLRENVGVYVRWWWYAVAGVPVACSGGCGRRQRGGGAVGWLVASPGTGSLAEWECAECFYRRNPGLAPVEHPLRGGLRW